MVWLPSWGNKLKMLLLLFALIIAPQAFCEEEFKFAKKQITVADKKINAEIADTNRLRARGLMFRTSLNDGEGMLFIFENEQALAFWMKNTFIPLSIGYFDKNQKLIDIQNMKPVESAMVESPPSYPSAKPAKYALEVPLNWFTKNKIKVGAQLKY